MSYNLAAPFATYTSIEYNSILRRSNSTNLTFNNIAVLQKTFWIHEETNTRRSARLYYRSCLCISFSILIICLHCLPALNVVPLLR